MRAGNVGMPLEWWGIRASVIHFLGEGTRSSVRHWLLSASDRFHRELVARWRELDCKLSARTAIGGCPNQRQQRVGKRSRPWLLTPMTAWNVRLQPNPTPLPTFGIESYRSPLEMNISGTIRVAVGRYHLGHHTKAGLGCTTGSGEHSRCAVPWGLGSALAPHARQPGLLLDW